jgi:glyoxylase-like metal-dependent hydrolase (beta-lactamase superfamily II)
MIVKLFCPGLLETGPVSETLLVIRDGWVNFFVVKAPGGLLCIDTGWRAANVSRSFERFGLDIQEVKAVFLTHLHWDHARCLSLFKQAEIYVGEHEQPHVFMRHRVAEHAFHRLHDGQTLSVCGLDMRALATPGHTPGSISYLVGNSLLFTGDTLRLKYGSVIPSPACFNQDGEVLKASLRKLASVQGVDCLLTAHSGISKKPVEAFAPWAPLKNNQPGGLAP